VSKRLSVVDVDSCVGCQCCMFACARRLGQGGLRDAVIGIRSAGGVRRGFLVVVCRACPDPPCARVCPTDALVARPGGGVHLHPDLCIGCGNCVQACPFRAIFWDAGQNKPQICVYCGYCARYCPYDVLALEEVAALPAAAPGVTGSPLPAVSDSVSAPEATDAKR
jgi:carbon-monoxide dehydrogenase iron sulfur subunit